MWLSPKEVRFEIIDGKRVGFRKPPPDPIDALKARVKYLEDQLAIERGINWYEFWKNKIVSK